MIIPIEKYNRRKNKDFFEKLYQLKKLAPIGSAEEVIDLKNEGRR